MMMLDVEYFFICLYGCVMYRRIFITIDWTTRFRYHCKSQFYMLKLGHINHTFY